MERPRFQLPTAEDDLWEQVVLALLRQRDVVESQARDHLRLLEQLGFEKRFCHRTLTEAFVLNTATWLAEEMKLAGPGDKAREWLTDLENWQLLALQGSGPDATYEFPIPRLDEYFAARHLAARWAENDERYRAWLPRTKVWWQRGEELICSNRHCQSALPPFRHLLRQAEYEETLLLMVGLLKERGREKTLLNGIGRLNFGFDPIDWLNFILGALGRCRFEHPRILNKVKDPLMRSLYLVHRGLAAVGRARTDDNLAPVINLVVWKLRSEWATDRAAAAEALGAVGNVRATDPLIAVLRKDKVPKVRLEATIALRRIGDARSAPVLTSAAQNDEDATVRWEAAKSLWWISSARAAELLEVVLKHEDPDVRRIGVRTLEWLCVSGRR